MKPLELADLLEANARFIRSSAERIEPLGVAVLTFGELLLVPHPHLSVGQTAREIAESAMERIDGPWTVDTERKVEGTTYYVAKFDGAKVSIPVSTKETESVN